jgi:hypothetical protein
LLSSAHGFGVLFDAFDLMASMSFEAFDLMDSMSFFRRSVRLVSEKCRFILQRYVLKNYDVHFSGSDVFSSKVHKNYCYVKFKTGVAGLITCQNVRYFYIVMITS